MKFFVLLRVLCSIHEKVKVIWYRQSKSEKTGSCGCVFYHWILKKFWWLNIILCIINNLTSSDYWNLHWIIRLGAVWSHYWDEIKDRITKVSRMFWCLTNEKSNFAIVVARYEISYGIYSKITRHSAILSTCIRSIRLYLATSFPEFLGLAFW